MKGDHQLCRRSVWLNCTIFASNPQLDKVGTVSMKTSNYMQTNQALQLIFPMRKVKLGIK